MRQIKFWESLEKKKKKKKIARIFILKTIYFISQNMLRSLPISSSVVHIKSAANILIIKGLLKCLSIVKNTFEIFYLTINTNIMIKTIKIFYINY